MLKTIYQSETKLKILKTIIANGSDFKKKQRMRNYRKESAYFTCKVTKQDFARIKKRASLTGLKPTCFFKKSALAYLDQSFVVPADIKNNLQTVIFLMRNMTNNFNQIAKHSNRFQQICFPNILTANQTLLELEALIKNFVKKPPIQK